MRASRLCVVCFLLVLFTAALPAQTDGPPGSEKPADDADSSAGDKSGGDEKKEEKKEKEKSFQEVVEEMERVDGLFAFYRDPTKNKVLLELTPAQFDQPFLFSSKLDRGLGERGLYGTLMANSFVFEWRRLGDRVQLFQINTRFRAKDGTPAARAVENAFSDSLLAGAKVLSKPHPERDSVLVDASEVFLKSDLFNTFGPTLKRLYDGAYKLDADDSAISLVKSFPKNTEVGVVMSFQAGEAKKRSITLPNSRALTLYLRYSLVELPENGYVPRLADDRVGYFMDMHLDYTSDRPDSPYVRYINRWKLEKKNPDAAVSEPVEPIVFWLENTIPVEYRAAIREGAELWNAAFENAGFRNALVVKQQPDDADWDPADIRYNTLRWLIGYDATFAIGPSHSNPYTGQLLDADIGISEGIIRLAARKRYESFVHPTTAGEAARHGDIDPESLDSLRGLCSYATDGVDYLTFAHEVLAARPDWNAEEEEEFVRQYIVELTAHEVGHTLGLRHNFRSSTIHDVDALSGLEQTGSTALAASVMDYNPPVLALAGEEQGDYFPLRVGTYDHWAIEYGYKPIPGVASPEDEREALAAIASRSADPALPYGTDEDAGTSPRSLDPRNTRYDFASEPLDWFEHEFQLIDELWNNAEAKLLSEGESYTVLRRAFGATWTPYGRGAHVAMKYIAGIEHNRDHVGDPDGRNPFVPVSAERQRRALRFLAEHVWAEDAFAVPDSLMRRLQFERFRDFEGSSFSAQRLDYPLHDRVLAVQAHVLDDLYDATKLKRLQDLERMIEPGAEYFSIAELYEGIRDAIWAELPQSQDVNSYRRNLQRAHLLHLVEQVVKQPRKLPGDAIALARADLVLLQGQLRGALARGDSDAVTRAHYADSLSRIEKALAAQLQMAL